MKRFLKIMRRTFTLAAFSALVFAGNWSNKLQGKDDTNLLAPFEPEKAYADIPYAQGYYQGYYQSYYQGYYQGYYEGQYVTTYDTGCGDGGCSCSSAAE